MLKDLIEEVSNEHTNTPKIIGVSSVVLYKEGYLFTISKEKYWRRVNNNYLIDYEAVGGKVRRHEDVITALKREAFEEIRCRLNIINSRKTIFVDGNKRKYIKVGEEPKPFLIYKKFYQGLPGKPDAPGRWLLFCVAYLSRIIGNPQPSSEVPAILYLPKSLFWKCMKRVKLKRLLEEGAVVIEKRGIPMDAFIRPSFTPKIILESKIRLEV
jgi:ADP-ribose pyrophosphatase YjhB (NUDIX family)